MSDSEQQSSKGPIAEQRAVASPFATLREDFIALTKARLSALVVFTSAFGYFLATKGEGTFSWATLGHTVFGSLLAAFGAAVFNQLMEIEADARMERTADRPLPGNRIPRPVAFAAGWLFASFGIIHLGMKTEIAAAGVAAATLFVYLFVYTPMKRVTSVNTVMGAVSGALPPLIGWAAGGGGLLAPGAAFLFALLFFWQLPHFAAINWIYREEYRKGGFAMWSNDDESGRKTARIALFFSLCVTAVAVGFALGGVLAMWHAAAGGLLGAVMVWLAVRFLRSGRREDARTLFFYTLLYLPLAMVAGYLAWK